LALSATSAPREEVAREIVMGFLRAVRHQRLRIPPKCRHAMRQSDLLGLCWASPHEEEAALCPRFDTCHIVVRDAQDVAPVGSRPAPRFPPPSICTALWT
jgi:hypothetical protein